MHHFFLDRHLYTQRLKNSKSLCLPFTIRLKLRVAITQWLRDDIARANTLGLCELALFVDCVNVVVSVSLEQWESLRVRLRCSLLLEQCQSVHSGDF